MWLVFYIATIASLSALLPDLEPVRVEERQTPYSDV